MDFPYFIVFPYAVLLVVYLIFEQKHRFKTATVLKLCLSGTFTAVGWCTFASSGGAGTAFLMFAVGMSFSAVGDFFTQYILTDNNKLRLGILFFAIAQVFFIIGLYLLYPVSPYEFIIYAVLLAIAIILRQIQKWDTSDVFPFPEIYTLLVPFMAAKALSALFAGGDVMMIAIGGLLFYASDILLAVWKYHTQKMCLAHLNWITYFSGQLLIALGVWSIYLMQGAGL